MREEINKSSEIVEKRRFRNELLYLPFLFLKDLFRNLVLRFTPRYLIYVDKRKKIIFFPIPKVAFSTFTKMFKNCELKNVTERKIKRLYGGYFKFAFVRNPYDRLVSCYFNKMKGEILNDKVTYWDFWRYNGKFYDKKSFSEFKEFYRKMTFEEFVKIVCSIPENESNKHFKSQHCFITDRLGKLIVDYVGKFENLEEEFRKICEKRNLKIPSKFPHSNKSKRKKNFSKYYSKHSEELIKKRYKKDFDLFGYESNITR